MSTDDFIIGLFCRVDRVLGQQPKHPQAKLHPSEVVTLALLFALKGVGPRAFYRWITQDYHAWFPTMPERTRLFRLFARHQAWASISWPNRLYSASLIRMALNCAIRGVKIEPISRLVARACPIIVGLWGPSSPTWSISTG